MSIKIRTYDFPSDWRLFTYTRFKFSYYSFEYNDRGYKSSRFTIHSDDPDFINNYTIDKNTPHDTLIKILRILEQVKSMLIKEVRSGEISESSFSSRMRHLKYFTGEAEIFSMNKHKENDKINSRINNIIDRYK